MLDKFDHVQPGNTVYIVDEVYLRHGFGRQVFRQKFTIPLSVERTTKSQFMVNGKAYWKKNGREVGGYIVLKLDGADQTKQRDHHQNRLAIIRKFFDMLNRDVKDEIVKKPIDDVYRAAYKMLSEIDALLGVD